MTTLLNRRPSELLPHFFTKGLPDFEESYYFNARWYDPETARFITEDPVRDGLLWYAYTNNKPLKFTDPTGLSTWEDITPPEYDNDESFLGFLNEAADYNRSTMFSIVGEQNTLRKENRKLELKKRSKAIEFVVDKIFGQLGGIMAGDPVSSSETLYDLQNGDPEFYIDLEEENKQITENNDRLSELEDELEKRKEKYELKELIEKLEDAIDGQEDEPQDEPEDESREDSDVTDR